MTWRDHAACAGHNPDPWTFPPASMFGAVAVAICETCPVIDECTAEADASGVAGIRGRHYLDVDDVAHCETCGWFFAGGARWCSTDCEDTARRRMMERMRHGVRRYNLGCRCPKCREAQALKKRRWRARRARVKMTSNITPRGATTREAV